MIGWSDELCTDETLRAATQRPSSPAAGSAENEVRNERSERSCKRSGAAPCSAAVIRIALYLREPFLVTMCLYLQKTPTPKQHSYGLF